MPANKDTDFVRGSLFPDEHNLKPEEKNTENVRFSGEDLKKLAAKIAADRKNKPGKSSSNKKWNRRPVR